MGRAQTVQAGADEMGGVEGVLGGGGGEEEEAGRWGHPTAATGMGRTWVGAAQNNSEGPIIETKTVKKKNSTALSN